MHNLKILAAAALMAFLSVPASANTDVTATISVLQAMQWNQDCFYLILNGVSVADATANPSSGWFAFPRNQYGAKDAYAMALMAKATNTAVHVVTNGQVSCGGYATVVLFLME